MNQTTSTGATITVIIFLILGITVAGLLMIFTGTLNGEIYQTSESDINQIGVDYLTNASFTASYCNQTTWTVLAGNPVINSTGNKWHVYNNAGADKTVNFTVSLANGTIHLNRNYGTVSNKKNNPLNNTACTITYQYGNETIRNYIKAGIVATFQGQATISGYLPIIVLAIIIVLIIGLIMDSLLGSLVGSEYNRPGSGTLF